MHDHHSGHAFGNQRRLWQPDHPTARRLDCEVTTNTKPTMQKLLTIIALVSLSAFSASALTEENIHQARPAKAGGKLIVEVDFGSIDVAPGGNDKVVVDAHRKIEASSKEKEQEYFAAVPVTVTTEGDNVAVRAIRKHESLGAE